MSLSRTSAAYNVIYAVVLGTACAGILTAGSKLLGPYREANERADEIRDVLGILGVPFEPGASSADLIALFEKNVRREQRGRLTLYRQVDAGGRVLAVAVPLAGRGLWGPIRGWLALEPDLKTIRGITFQAPDETPGFGGEIMKAPFRDQFRGKTIYGPDGRPTLRVTRGEGPTGPNEVHAVSGATLTSSKVHEILNDLVRQIAEETQADVR